MAVSPDEKSIVDEYFSSNMLPSNFYVTIRELQEVAKGDVMDERSRTKLRCLAHLLYEQVIGNASLNDYLSLKNEWIGVRSEEKEYM